MQRRKDTETRRAEVFTAIAEIISEQGMASVSTMRVAEKLGVSQPAFYKYFKNRDEMLIDFLDYFNALLMGILETVDRFETTEEKLQAMYQAQLELIQETTILPKVLFFEEFHLDNGEKRDKLKEMVDNYEAGIKGVIIEGIQRKEIIDFDPDTVVQFIKGAILSAYLNWMLSGMDYSLVAEKDKFMDFLKKTIFV